MRFAHQKLSASSKCCSTVCPFKIPLGTCGTSPLGILPACVVRTLCPSVPFSSSSLANPAALPISADGLNPGLELKLLSPMAAPEREVMFLELEACVDLIVKRPMRERRGRSVGRQAQIMPRDCSTTVQITAVVMVYSKSLKFTRLKAQTRTMEATQALWVEGNVSLAHFIRIYFKVGEEEGKEVTHSVPSRKTPLRVIFDLTSRFNRQTIIIGIIKMEKSIRRFATPFHR